MTNPLPRRILGRTGLAATPVCAGTAQLGDMVEAVGYTVPEETALRTLHSILSGPINFLDTAAAYGDGKSEQRVGRAIREFGGLPPDFLLATKADRDLTTLDFSGDQARRSIDRSLRLLGLTRLPLVYFHDPESSRQTFEELTGPGGALEVLLGLQREGVIGHLGIAASDLELTDRYLSTNVFSVAITHNRLTLLDRTAEPFIARWARSVAVVNAAPYGGGILARGTAHGRYMYRPTIPASIAQRVEEIERICAGFDVPVRAAALRFSMGHDAVSSTIVGMSSPAEVDETVRLASTPIPAELWAALGVSWPA